MMNSPLISVIIPVYNVEKYLAKCVESVISQTYTNLEIILVDDGATDGSPRMCDDFAKIDSRIKVVHKTNGGQSDARNAGIEIARGEYIGFVDADDYIEKEMYGVMLDLMQKEKSDICMCKMDYVYENGKVLHLNEVNLTSCDKTNIIEHFIRFGKKIAGDEIVTENVMGSACRCLYSRQVVDGISFPNNTFSEDLIFNIKVCDKANKISVADEYLYNYFQRSNSTMRTFDEHKYLIRKNFTKQVLPLLQDKVASEKLSAYCFHLYELFLNDLSCANNKSLFHKFKKDKELQLLNSKENYKCIQKLTKSKKYKIANFIVRKKWFWVYKCMFILFRG